MIWPDWKSVVFAEPRLLWLLLALPLLALLRSRRGPAAAIVYSSLQPFRSLGAPRKSSTGGWLFGLFLLGCALLICGLARPQQTNVISKIRASGIDIMLALDVSGSMMAEDVTIGADRANRIEAVKKLSEDFIADRPNDRIGIVAFAGLPYLVSPLTLNHEWLLTNVEQRVHTGLGEDGTAIGSALAACANRLRTQKESKSKIIVLLTDGSNNAGKVTPTTAAEAAHALGIKIYTIGIGTTGEAKIPVHDQFGRTFYQWIHADVDEPLLQKLADIGKGRFYRATDAKAIQQVFAEIDKLEKTTVEMTESKNFDDLFPWFITVGAAFVVAHLLLEQTIRRTLP